MQCVVQLNTDNPLNIGKGVRCEYLARFASGNHFVSVTVAETWPQKGLIIGEARVLAEDLVAPLIGDILGFNDSDVRGWLLLLPSQYEENSKAR